MQYNFRKIQLIAFTLVLTMLISCGASIKKSTTTTTTSKKQEIYSKFSSICNKYNLKKQNVYEKFIKSIETNRTNINTVLKLNSLLTSVSKLSSDQVDDLSKIALSKKSDKRNLNIIFEQSQKANSTIIQFVSASQQLLKDNEVDQSEYNNYIESYKLIQTSLTSNVDTINTYFEFFKIPVGQCNVYSILN